VVGRRVQDFAPDVQRAINRIQGIEQTLAAIAACRRSGFRSVNVDLIYGLPPVWRGLELDFDDEVRADVIQRLMCLGELDIAAVEQRYSIDFMSYFSEALERLRPLVADGLATVVGSYICATPRGRLLMRVIAMCFDRYRRAASGVSAKVVGRAPPKRS
jgi:coproporphyrinogen III oxidase-like Fe-S oxidoreductase